MDQPRCADKATFGYGARAGFGKRPAVVVIDVSFNFCGDRPEPILESIRRWPNSCGEDACLGIAAIRRLVEATRAKGVLVTGAFRRDQWNMGCWSWKNSRTTSGRQHSRPSGKPAELPVEALARFELVRLVLDPFNRIGRTTSNSISSSLI